MNFYELDDGSARATIGAGLSTLYISQLETKRRRAGSARTLRKIADAVDNDLIAPAFAVEGTFEDLDGIGVAVMRFGAIAGVDVGTVLGALETTNQTPSLP